jgi:hypothetical protein
MSLARLRNARRQSKELRSRCSAMMTQLDLPTTFSVSALCRAVEVHTGRQIALHPMQPGWGPAGICGLLVSTAAVDHIFFTAGESLIQQATTIVHECGHILYDGPVVATAAKIPRVAYEVAPALREDLVLRVRGRSDLSDLEELTVETFASVVLKAGLAGDLSPSHPHSHERLCENFG